MTAFNGKWTLKSSENMDAFMEACGVSAEVRASALPKIDNVGGMVEEYIYDAASNSSKRNIYQNGTLSREGKSISMGKDISDTTLDGRQITARFELPEPTKATRTEQGPGYTSTAIMQIAGNSMTITMTCGSVCAVRKYEKQ
ncbi:hypothetical protein CAPTEDRAFT_19960 [Capitella teleta]|uniref:Cytosolic fatty-acid binding proteins domain-containing protein n=1 Tax=Capitella teleta TaxID=283909 RepID=R7TGP1_CAPTE|nr:hypothetical protein CAPTEDRAFT_19960 [Capitella teleta]|eukprot:ELT92662.1 hypothetical protein CAPTEDRAFT_19960 [Capitella teleta]